MTRFAFACVLLVACKDPEPAAPPPSSQPVNAAQTIDPDAPEWTGDPVVIDKTSGVVRAVGEAKGIANPALATAAAENRARALIMKALTAEKTVAGSIEGAKVVNTYTSQKDKTVYVQVEAPLK